MDTLTTFLSDDYVANIAGGKLKETGTTHWISPNTGATNETGFTALPGGSNGTLGGFKYIGSDGSWWSSTAYSTGYVTTAYVRYIYNNDTKVGRTNWSENNGLSVRCIKN